MEEASEKGKELSHSAHANGMKLQKHQLLKLLVQQNFCLMLASFKYDVSMPAFCYGMSLNCKKWQISSSYAD